jgi:ABC-type lipoprotein export system ATPase subunit/bifunctional DNA-binding transcriptional regulator/antitoxin component of YhaV-PrlF toxin-antitoxin module
MFKNPKHPSGAQTTPLGPDPFVPAEISTPDGRVSPTDEAISIVCDNLVKIYKVAELEVFALQGLDLVVRRGELLGIIGASGSGKSTLMNILGGLDRPSAGRAWVDGMDLLNMSDNALDRYRRTMVGFVWQQGARNLIPYLNALENVELPMTLAGASGKEKRRRAEELIEAVGLKSRRKHRLSELSGGEQQRVAIAVALANSPHLLLADEPTGELDSNTALSIYKTFQDLNQIYGLTILIVSHDPTIARHVHRVVAIRDGKLATETVRQTRTVVTNGGGDAETEGETAPTITHEEVLQEFTVLDSAGRLQIPKDYLSAVNIRSRVFLEVTDAGILIKPVDEAGHGPSAEMLGAELAASKRSRAGSLRHRLVERVLKTVNPTRKGEG